MIAVLYGRQSQWVRNVMASDSFTLRTKGRDYQLEQPEIIPSLQALAAYPRLWQWTLKRQRIDQFVWAHSAPTRGTGISRPRHRPVLGSLGV